MGAPISDDEDSEHSKYAPERFREQTMPAAPQLYVSSAPTVPSSKDVDQDRRTRSEFASRPERISEPSRRWWDDGALTLMYRIVVVGSFAALVALLTIFAKPLWQGAGALLNADSQTSQAVKPSDRLTANSAPANSALFQPPRLQRRLARSRLQARRRSKPRSHRARKNRGARFGG